MSDRNVHLTPKDAAQPQAPRRVVEWAQAAQVPPSATGVVTIDLAQIRANWRTLARRVAPAECGAVVKADAYGLGAARVIPTLYEAGCRNFFVATQAEAKTAHRARPRRHHLRARRHPSRMRARACRHRRASRAWRASMRCARGRRSRAAAAHAAGRAARRHRAQPLGMSEAEFARARRRCRAHGTARHRAGHEPSRLRRRRAAPHEPRAARRTSIASARSFRRRAPVSPRPTA